MLLTLPNVEFYLDESIVGLRIQWNYFDSNTVANNVVQWKFIQPLIFVIKRRKPTAFRQADL